MLAVPTDLKGRSFRRVTAWAPDELLQVLDLADRLKELQAIREEHRLLPGRTLGTAPARRCGTRPRTGCTRRRR